MKMNDPRLAQILDHYGRAPHPADAAEDFPM